MFHLAATRFNNCTYTENLDYRKNNNEIAIYGAPLKIRDIYSVGCCIFVIEMNNELNRIEGVSLIRNNLVNDKKYKIYKNAEYNRYVYRGTYWISRQDIEAIDTEIVQICDLILFKGKSHLKRRTGITILTDKLFTNWRFDLRTLKNKIKCLFIRLFKHNEIEMSQEETEISHEYLYENIFFD
jgi:hypothetical protein